MGGYSIEGGLFSRLIHFFCHRFNLIQPLNRQIIKRTG